MAETEETLTEYLRLTAPLHDGRTAANENDWLNAAPDAPTAHDFDPAAWRPDSRLRNQGPVRWMWKYRGSPGVVMRRGIPRSMRRNPIRTLVVGNGLLGDRLAAELRSHPSYLLVGYLCRQSRGEGPELDDERADDCDVLEQLDKIAVRERIDCLVVAGADRRGDLPMDELLACRFRGIHVEDGVTFFERVSHKIPLDGLRPSHFLFHGGFRWPSRAVKRAADLCLAIAALLCAAPIFLLLPVLIKLTSRGPVFYRQERLGKDGRPFTILKFRSMRQNAETPGRAMWAEERDPRVTPLGRFMRQYRLDELPQVINVLRGEMSMIGPRPERPEFIDRLSKDIPFYPYRLAVKPGITGWAQVKFRYGATVQDAAEKLQYDLYYIKHMSLRLDGLIALKTLHTVLFRSGAR